MIAGVFHKGSGLGDQLMRYITVRTLAEAKGYSWGMYYPNNFKGKTFMDISTNSPYVVLPDEIPTTFLEKDVRENGIDIRSYDPEINFVQDDTLIDGCFEDEKYWGHNLDNIRNWLAVEPLKMPEDMCVIGFRGGEYYTDPNLGLPREYFDEAIEKMTSKGITKFEVHTDDPSLAQKFFPDYVIVQDIALNWRSVRYAKHLIIANSAFYIMPALLGEAEEIIAPRYWARRNIKTWARPACYYKDKRIQYI